MLRHNGETSPTRTPIFLPAEAVIRQNIQQFFCFRKRRLESPSFHSVSGYPALQECGHRERQYNQREFFSLRIVPHGDGTRVSQRYKNGKRAVHPIWYGHDFWYDLGSALITRNNSFRCYIRKIGTSARTSRNVMMAPVVGR